MAADATMLLASSTPMTLYVALLPSIGLRSITLSATAETLAACIGADLIEDAIDWAINGMRARLLTAPSGEDGALLVHLLIDSSATKAQKIAASTALETLRRQAEAAANRGEAA